MRWQQPQGFRRYATACAIDRRSWFLVLVGMVSASCTVSDDGLVGKLLSRYRVPTPSQTAREAFHLHDADIRRQSIMRLAAAPFGGEQPYVRMYRLLLDDPTLPCARLVCAHWHARRR